MTPLLPIPIKTDAKYELLRARAEQNILILNPLWIIPAGLPQNELPCSSCTAEGDVACGRGRSWMQYTGHKNLSHTGIWYCEQGENSLSHDVSGQCTIVYSLWSSGQSRVHWETHTGIRSVWNTEEAGESQWLGCEGWGSMSNYLTGKERGELAN